MMNTTYYNGPFFLNPMDDDMLFNHFSKEYRNNNWHYQNNPYDESKSLIYWLNTHSTEYFDFYHVFTMWLFMYIIHMLMAIFLPHMHSIELRSKEWYTIINAMDIYVCMNTFIFYVPFYVNNDMCTKFYMLLLNSIYWFIYYRMIYRSYPFVTIIMTVNLFWLGYITAAYFNLTYD